MLGRERGSLNDKGWMEEAALSFLTCLQHRIDVTRFRVESGGEGRVTRIGLSVDEECC